VQTTIYYTEQDKYLLKLVKKKADRERRSKSSVILSILEEYFEAEKNIGGILQDLGVLSSEQLEEALSLQQNGKSGKRLGQILKNKGYIQQEELERALEIQKNHSN